MKLNNLFPVNLGTSKAVGRFIYKTLIMCSTTDGIYLRPRRGTVRNDRFPFKLDDDLRIRFFMPSKKLKPMLAKVGIKYYLPDVGSKMVSLMKQHMLDCGASQESFILNVKNIHTTVDPESGAIYILLGKQKFVQRTSTILRSWPTIKVNYDKSNKVIGVEILT